MVTFISNSVAETEAIGRRFASEMQAGSVVALQGELGAGKTHFTKGLVAGLGGDIIVTSPTFTLVHEYSGGRLPVYHFDFFRLEDLQSLQAIGLDDYLFGDGLSVIEWADRFPDLIPKEARWVTLAIQSEATRIVKIR